MKSRIGYFVVVMGLLLLVAAMVTFGKPADSVEKQVATTDIMCIKEDGFAVTITARTLEDGTCRVTIIDGSVENMELPMVTSIRQADGGVEIDWGSLEAPTTMTILGARIVEIIP